ncbi:MAG: serine/threonine-protein kinase [Vicinamibacteria bacterium]|nr:serine/threonine-protein kinase [Vicinamibacteria bacterium]
MSLPSGTRLGPYEIVAAIGAGGMGEVLRARDTKLGREVAIKVLPAAFAQDAERVARFRREAQILAALNHPNIAAIHGLEEGEGVLALAMELVEGEDLAARLKRGAIPVDESVAIAKQIAEALEEAHEKGIVHRDLKPANVKVTADGKVKVLDFGLAKAYMGADPMAQSGSHDLSQSPTLAGAGTMAGMILGTAAYMSPEQARGKAVDKRADIWAFGVVLFEMLTGRRLFEGETVSDTLAAVLTREPDWAALPAATPLALGRLLERCLQRDPKKRLRDIGEAALVLADPGGWATASAAPAQPVLARRERVAWALAAAATVAALAFAFSGSEQGAAVAAGPLYLEIPGDPSQSAPRSPAISWDGLQVAFVGQAAGSARPSIFVRSLLAAKARALAGTEGASGAMAFSPDGRWLVFFVDFRALKKIPVEGGPVTTLFEGNLRAASVTWLEGDRLVLAQLDGDHPGVLHELPASGGAPQRLPGEPAQATETVRSPRPVPGQPAVLLQVQGPTWSLAAQSLTTGERRVLAPGAGGGTVVGSHLVWLEGDRILAAPFDAAGLKLTGTPAPIPTDGLGVGDPPAGLQAASDGSLFLTRRSAIRTDNSAAEADQRLMWIDRNGTRTRVKTGESVGSEPRISPDGTQVAVDGAVPNSRSDVWTIDLDRGAVSRLSFDEGEDETAVWSPDGRWIAWTASRMGGGRALYRRRSDGSGSEERVWASDGRHFHAASWTAAGIVITMEDPKTGWDVHLVTLGDEPVARPLLAERYNESSARVSRDGRFVVYVSDESGRDEIYAQAFPGLGHKVQLSVAGGTEPVWHPKGGEVVYRAATSRDFMGVTVQAGEVLVPAAPRVLASDAGTDRGGADHTNYDVAADGRLLVFEEPSEEVRRSLHVVLGWGRAAGLVR